MRRLLWSVGVAALLTLPGTASAAITAVSTMPFTGFAACVDTDDAATPVTFQLVNPNDGAVIETSTTAPADATPDVDCSGAAAPGTTAYPASLTSLDTHGSLAVGANVVATQATSSITFPIPYAGSHHLNTMASALKIRHLPANVSFSNGTVAGTADINGNLDIASTAHANTRFVTDPGALTSGVPYTAEFRAVEFNVDVGLGQSDTDFRDIGVSGVDPLGAAITVTLLKPDGTTLVDSQTLRPRVSPSTQPQPAPRPEGQFVAGTFDTQPVNGDIVRVSQSGWFDTAITGGSATISGGGFAATIPAATSPDGGITSSGTFGVTGPFGDPSEPTFADLSSLCLDLGAAASLPCGFAVDRYAASYSNNLFLAAGDTAWVNYVQWDDDQMTVATTLPGAQGTLDDGSFFWYGAALNSHGTVDISNPESGGDPYTESDDKVTSDGDGFVDVSFFFYTHVHNHAEVVPKGALFGAATQAPYDYNLAYTVNGSAVAGTTYPFGFVALREFAGPLEHDFFARTDAAGQFNFSLPDFHAGDTFTLAGGDAITHYVSYSNYAAGQLTPSIIGVADGDYVSGTISPQVTGAGIDRVVWGGDLTAFNVAGAPFGYPIDTTQYDDGTYRLQATALPSPSATDYLYLTIDNTAPDGVAGPPQTVAPQHKVWFVTQASDDTSGLASVDITFGDGKKVSQIADNLGLPVAHIYTKTGNFNVHVTITDAAGNVTTAATKVHVTRKLVPAVTGKIVTSIKHGAALKTRLKSNTAGELWARIISSKGKVLRTQVFRFGDAVSKKLTFRTAALGRARYTLALQFIDDNGVPGPVTAQTLLVH